MKQFIFLTILTTFFICSCTTSPKEKDNTLIEKIESLEKRIEKLNSEIETQKLKMRIHTSMIFADPLDQFFASDWETVDVGGAECAKRCISELNDRKKPCFEIEDEKERIKCIIEAVTVANNCHRNCNKQFPFDL